MRSKKRNKYRRHRRKYSSRPKKMSKDEQFQWGIAIAIFVLFFIIYFAFGFISNCIWEWPPRRDVSTCWNEQIHPAQEKATEKAAPFVP